MRGSMKMISSIVSYYNFEPGRSRKEGRRVDNFLVVCQWLCVSVRLGEEGCVTGDNQGFASHFGMRVLGRSERRVGSVSRFWDVEDGK